MELGNTEIGVLGIVALLLLCCIGVRFAIAGAIVGTFGLASLIGWDAGIRTVGIVPYSAGTNYTLSVLPMFILIGYLAYYAGITQTAYEAARRWFGWLPGGLATATVFAVAGFSAVSGASSAAAAVFAKVAIPEMLRAKYNRQLAAGVCAAGATLDSLIPPSTLLVVYAIIVEESVGKLLIAGFVPGLVSALLYTAIITFRCWRDPTEGPRITGFTWGQRFSSLPGTAPIFLVIFIVFFSMYYGWATPTEAGALGAFCVFLFALHNGIKRNEINQCLLDSAKLTVMIFTVIWGVMIFVRFLSFTGLPEDIARWATDLDVRPIFILLAIYALYFVLGTVLEGIGMFLLTLPVIFPVIKALGYDPIWFGIVLVKLSGIASLSPPVGLVVFVVNGVRPDIPVRDIFKGIWPFIFADLVTLAVLTAFPGLVTFLVDSGD